jgi:uncharacterized membrane protein
MQKKTKLIIASLLLAIAFTSAACATMIANYLWTTHIVVTSSPGITVEDENGAIQYWNLGDVQKGFSKQKTVTIYNVGGGTVYILPGSLVTTNLPTGVTVTWGITGPVTLGQGQNIQTFIKVSVDSTATPNPYDFTIEIDAFDSPSG